MTIFSSSKRQYTETANDYSYFSHHLPLYLKQDGYTMEVTGPEAVSVRVATKAKPNRDSSSSLNREFFKSFLDVSSTRPWSIDKSSTLLPYLNW